jgi:hypothetical protein
VTVTGVVGSYGALPEPIEVMSRAAKAAKALRSRTPAKLCVYDTLLQRLPQHLQDMAAELGPFIQEEHAMVGQRPLARHRHGAPINPRAGMEKWAVDKSSIDPACLGRGHTPCEHDITSAGAARWSVPLRTLERVFFAVRLWHIAGGALVQD